MPLALGSHGKEATKTATFEPYRWFAKRRSSISEPFAEIHPFVCGLTTKILLTVTMLLHKLAISHAEFTADLRDSPDQEPVRSVPIIKNMLVLATHHQPFFAS